MYSLDQDTFRLLSLAALLAAAVVCTGERLLVVPEVCGSDEYYDGVVEQCQKCADICPRCDHRANATIFCVNNCKHYLHKCGKFPEAADPLPDFDHVTSPAPLASDGSLPGSEQLLGNSVVLALIVCCCVAFLVLIATVGLLLVLVSRRHVTSTRCQEQRKQLVSRCAPAYSRSTSASSDDKKMPLIDDGVHLLPQRLAQPYPDLTKSGSLA
jgi:hypothetical protein